MTFTFGIPAANNNPSNDQPLMRDNFTAISNLINVDHIGFNTATSGLHQQIHFPTFTAPTVINGTLTQGSLIYPAAGVEDITRAQAYFKNDFNVALPLSLIKAFGRFDNAGNTVNAINLTAVGGAGVFTLTIPVGIVSGLTYSVFVATYSNAGATGVATNLLATTFDVKLFNSAGAAANIGFSVIVLQI